MINPITYWNVLLAQLDWHPLFEEKGIPLAIMGFVVVFLALVLVRVFIGTLPRIMAILNHYYPEPLETSHDPIPSVTTSDKIPEEIIAVIAAAVAETVREPHRIVHTRELTSEDMSWTLEKRLQHHTSHSIAPRSLR
jgi:Na+-transporting methylmalonyl-CoA/oxaloacetate decarboxylase gamma subunit